MRGSEERQPATKQAQRSAQSNAQGTGLPAQWVAPLGGRSEATGGPSYSQRQVPMRSIERSTPDCIRITKRCAMR